MNTSKLLQFVAAATVGIFTSASATAEVSELKMMSQYGIGYMQLTVMKHEKLIEKNLAKAGLPDTKVTWAKLGAGAAANDALLAGGLHFAAGGTGPALILWDRTRNNMGVRGVAALSSMPNMLITRNPDIKTLKDFTDKDRIAMAGAGSSVQTTYLQIATAKEFGIENYKKLAPLMVSLPHPEGLRALLSGSSEIDAQFTSPPFQNYGAGESRDSHRAQFLRHHGRAQHLPHGLGDEQVPRENPKTYKAVLDALKEATAAINADKRRAAEIYVAEGGGKESVDKIFKIMSDPQIRYQLAPEKILPFQHFMNQVGTLKNKAESWKDLFFPDIHDMEGS